MVVGGYDKTKTDITDALEDIGVSIHFEDDMQSVNKEFLNSENNACSLYACNSGRTHTN